MHIEYIGEPKGIEFLDFAWGDQQVIRNLVADKDPSVPVVDDSSGRVDYGLDHGIVVGIQLVSIVDDLDTEQFGNKNSCRNAQSDEKFGFPVLFHSGLFSVFFVEAADYKEAEDDAEYK